MTEKNSGNVKKLSRFKFSMMFGYTAVFVVIIIFICALVLKKTDDVLKTKVSSMTDALNVQMKMNINSYLSKLETTGTLIFASQEAYTYRASDETAVTYEAINTEDIISDELYDLCIMENFVDFGIVYDNNHVVGKISNGTVDLFGERLYDDLCTVITSNKTNDGWAAGLNGDFKRIYYVKRVNEGAVLVISFYTTELEDVFEHPGGMDDITVRLTDDENNIIYSSVDYETGHKLPDEINDRIVSSQTSVTVMDDEYLITVSGCGNNWKVICSVPTQIILKEKNEVQFYIILVAVAASIAALMVSAALSQRISDPVDSMMNMLAKKASMDQLTSTLNKKTFEDLADSTLQTSGEDGRFGLLLIDIDDFKHVNDTLGHAEGDKVLAEVGNILRKQFKNGAYLGRLGGDEFAVFLEIPKRAADSTEFVMSKGTLLCEAFRNNYADNDKKYKVSASIGAAVSPKHGKSFAQLYTKADKALYESKNKGKDTFSLYDGAEEDK